VTSGRKDISATHHHHTVSVDTKKGLYASAVCLRGPSYPVHVRKIACGRLAGIHCENISCTYVQQAAGRGGNLSFECAHVRSVQYAERGINHILDIKFLDTMVTQNLLTSEKAKIAREHQEDAMSKDVPLIVEIPNSLSSSSSMMYLSVHASSVRYWSKFGRTVVVFDKEKKIMTCRCCRRRRHCCHKAVGKWLLFQVYPRLLEAVEDVESDDEPSIQQESCHQYDDNVDTPEVGDCGKNRKKSMTSEQLENIIKYICSIKKYPVHTKKSVQFHFDVLPIKMIPREIDCHYCSCLLSDPLLATARGKIVLRDKVIRGIYVLLGSYTYFK